MEEKYNVTGMTCSACSSAVEKSVSKLEGVNKVSVNLLTNSMVVDYDNNIINNNKIIEEVKRAGYGASLSLMEKSQAGENNKEDVYEVEQRKMKLTLIWSFVFLIPLFYIAMGGMLGFPQLDFLVGEKNILNLALTQMFLTIPIIIINKRFFINGFQAFRRRVPNMDSLIALGAGAAFVYGVFAIYRISHGYAYNQIDLVHKYGHELYFESAGMILSLITLGKYFEAKAKRRTSDAISKLMDLTPEVANVERDGIEVSIPVSEIRIDEIVIIKPGENIPVDGVIISGSTTVDESSLTGESMPVEKEVGNKLLAATTNLNGYVKFKAENVGEDTTIAKIIKLVEDANATKAPIAKLADKISGVFVPIVIVIAIIAGIYWYLTTKNFEFALGITISVLVISCPCALGLATPVAIMVGTGKGAKLGVLYKSAESLEVLHKSDIVILDKTGTITKGKPQVTDILIKDKDINSFINKITSLEKGSEHPLSKAIMDYGVQNNAKVLEVSEFKAVTGKGVMGNIGDAKYIAGNSKLMKENNIEIDLFQNQSDMLASEGKTPLYFAENGSLMGIVAVADRIKESSKRAIKQLRDENIQVVMVTGDNKKTAEAIGKELSLSNIVAEVLPQEKESIVKKYQDEGKTVTMVGDGINDAPALARADVGIAIGAGTDIAIEAGDVVLMKSTLTDIVSAIDLSKATIKNIKENLFWAFFYNTLGIPIAAGIFYNSYGLKLNPMIGALAMSFSSIFVVSNALRLNLFKSKIEESLEDDESIENVVEIRYLDSKLKDSNELNKSEVKTMEKIMKINGMSCEHCKNRVETTLNAFDGVQAEVDLEKGEAKVNAPDNMDFNELAKAVTDAGYEVTEVI